MSVAVPSSVTPWISRLPLPPASTPTTVSHWSFTLSGCPSAGPKPKRSRRTCVADHAHERVALLVLAVEEAALDERELHERRVVGGHAQHARLRPARGREHLPGLHLDLRHHALDAGHGRADRRGVPAREAGGLPADLGELVLAVEALVLHHDVAQAHRVDDLERLRFGSRADREHRDHGAHAEDDAEHRQERAQRVVAQALEPRDQRLAGVDHWPGPAPAELAGRGQRALLARVPQRDHVSGREARGQHQVRDALARGRHLDRDECVAAPAVDDALAVLLEHGAARDREDAVRLVEAHDGAHLLAGLQVAGVRARERQRRLEVLDRRLPVARLGERLHAAHAGFVLLPGATLDREAGLLARLQAGPVGLEHEHLGLELRQVGHLGHLLPRPERVADGGHLAAPVPLEHQQAVVRRLDPQRAQALVRDLHLEPRLAGVDLAERPLGRGQLAARGELASGDVGAGLEQLLSSCDSMIWCRENRLSSVSLNVCARSSCSFATSRSRPSEASFLVPSACAFSILARAAVRSACPSAASRWAS